MCHIPLSANNSSPLPLSILIFKIHNLLFHVYASDYSEDRDTCSQIDPSLTWIYLVISISQKVIKHKILTKTQSLKCYHYSHVYVSTEKIYGPLLLRVNIMQTDHVYIQRQRITFPKWDYALRSCLSESGIHSVSIGPFSMRYVWLRVWQEGYILQQPMVAPSFGKYRFIDDQVI